MTLFGYTLRFLRGRKGMSLEALSDSLGIGTASLQNIENGYILPEEDTARRIADFFGVTVAYMKGSTDLTLSAEADGSLGLPQRFVRLRPVSLLDDPEKHVLNRPDSPPQEIILPLPATDRSDYIAVQVTDNSMSRYRALAGDYLVVRQDPLRIRDGELVLLLTDDGQKLLRRFFAEENGAVLRSDDDDFMPPIRLADCDKSLQVVGTVVQILLIADASFAFRLAQNPPIMPEEIYSEPAFEEEQNASSLTDYSHPYFFQNKFEI